MARVATKVPSFSKVLLSEIRNYSKRKDFK
jgi:hypothetical protein